MKLISSFLYTLLPFSYAVQIKTNNGDCLNLVPRKERPQIFDLTKSACTENSSYQVNEGNFIVNSEGECLKNYNGGYAFVKNCPSNAIKINKSSVYKNIDSKTTECLIKQKETPRRSGLKFKKCKLENQIYATCVHDVYRPITVANYVTIEETQDTTTPNTYTYTVTKTSDNDYAPVIFDKKCVQSVISLENFNSNIVKLGIGFTPIKTKQELEDTRADEYFLNTDKIPSLMGGVFTATGTTFYNSLDGNLKTEPSTEGIKTNDIFELVYYSGKVDSLTFSMFTINERSRKKTQVFEKVIVIPSNQYNVDYYYPAITLYSKGDIMSVTMKQCA